MRQLPPLAAVRTFEAAARHENFTFAGAELGMTQAAVSYQIKLLEERLGLPLFHRAKQRVTLSDAGRRLAPLLTDSLDRMAAAFGSLVGEDESVLTISTAQTFASNWLAPRLGTFQIERPELAVRLQTTSQFVDFVRDDVDVAIRMGMGPWPGLHAHFLFRLHGTPMCTPEFCDRHQLKVPADLLRVPRLSPDDVWWKLWLAEAKLVEPEGVRPGGILLDSQVTEGNAVLAGHGVSMLTPLFWKAELASGRLVQPFPQVIAETRAIWLVYPEHKRGRAKLRAFRDWLLRAMAEEVSSAPPEVFIPPPDRAPERGTEAGGARPLR
ncbi:MAG TPA: LysR substrate-binding domain-containing protein [Allosphingosinicella sp.]|jgi:LysR family glycine cleavage system transcriptional activator